MSNKSQKGFFHTFFNLKTNCNLEQLVFKHLTDELRKTLFEVKFEKLVLF